MQFMMEPVIRLCRATMNNEMEKVDKMLTLNLIQATDVQTENPLKECHSFEKFYNNNNSPSMLNVT